MKEAELGLVGKNSNKILENSPEQLCHRELSLSEIRDFVGFCEKNDCEDKYDAYRVFITDVPEQDKEKNVDTSFLDKIRTDNLNHFSSDRSFKQIRYFSNAKKTDDEISPLIYGRLYISPDIKNVPTITQKLIERYAENKKDLVCKISRVGERNDRIVIYLMDDLRDGLTMIKEIQNESPELFTNCGKNKLWCGIDGIKDVYFGGEPRYRGHSYGNDRARVIGEILALRKEKKLNIENDDELDRIFKLECLKYRVDPFNFGFYINDNDGNVGSAANYVLDGYTNEWLKQGEFYLDYLKHEEVVNKWLADNAKNSPQKSWLGDNIPEFNPN